MDLNESRFVFKSAFKSSMRCAAHGEKRHEMKCAQCEIPDSWKVLSGDRNGALSLVEGWRKPTNEDSAQPRGRCCWLLRELPYYKIPVKSVPNFKRDEIKCHGKDDGITVAQDEGASDGDSDVNPLMSMGIAKVMVMGER